MNEIARWLVRLEIPFLSLTYLYFILSDQLPLVTVVLLALIWAARASLKRKVTVRTPFDFPILLILLMLPVSLWVSSNWFLTLPKIYGIVLGVAVFYAIVNHVETPQDVMLAQVWLVLLCLAIAVAGLIGTDWAQSKIVSASFIYDRMPHVIQNIPRSIGGGFARNGIGGTLTFTIPLLAAMLVPSVIARACLKLAKGSPEGATKQSPIPSQEGEGERVLARNDIIDTWLPRIVLLALALSLVTLALTQSRGGILGTSAGLIALLLWRRPRIGLGIFAVGILTLVVLIMLGQGGAIANFMLKTDSTDGTLASRFEVWQRGWMMVQEFPFTGIGIGTYNVVAHALYPFFIAAPDEVVPHAHNQFLQVAVDLGIPGFVAYVSMLTAFVMCAVRAYRAALDQSVRTLIAGLGFGMLAHHVFGLTDAFILGTKPGLLMWIYFAIIAACYVPQAGHKT